MQLKLSSTGYGSSVGSGEARAVRILFVGNSYTARNDLPGMIRVMALQLGRRVKPRLIAAGGASLRRHWNAAGTITAVSEGWDFCVLQEQSTLPIRNPARYFESVRLFDQAIGAAGSRTVLYLPWNRQSEPADWEALNEAVAAIAHELGALVVPVGSAWRIARAQDPELPLYTSDGSHPTVAGTYLAACTFVRALFGEEPPDGPPGVSIQDARRRTLRDAASAAVEELEAFSAMV